METGTGKSGRMYLLELANGLFVGVVALISPSDGCFFRKGQQGWHDPTDSIG